ncbi:MAG: hypothetical protein WBN88_20715, partial [Anderseniella sp.]
AEESGHLFKAQYRRVWALLTPSPHHLRTVGPKTGAVLCVELELARRGTKYQFAALAEGAGQRPFLGIYVPRTVLVSQTEGQSDSRIASNEKKCPKETK